MLGNAAVDYNLLLRMGVAVSVHDTVKAVRGAKGDAIHRLPAGVQTLYDWLLSEGLA